MHHKSKVVPKVCDKCNKMYTVVSYAVSVWVQPCWLHAWKQLKTGPLNGNVSVSRNQAVLTTTNTFAQLKSCLVASK